jgi:hypothetical protein
MQRANPRRSADDLPARLRRTEREEGRRRRGAGAGSADLLPLGLDAAKRRTSTRPERPQFLNPEQAEALIEQAREWAVALLGAGDL